MALVLAVHVLFVMAPAGRGGARAPSAELARQQPLQPLQPLQVRLVDLSLWRRQPEVAAPPRTQPARETPRRPPRALPADTPAAAGPEAPAPAAVQPAPGEAARTQSAAPPSLNLDLPLSASAPWRQTNPAVDAQIGRAVPHTVESRIAEATAGTGPWTQERLGTDRVLMRRGSTCFTLERPRTAHVLPLDTPSQRSPWMASRPFRC